MKPVSTDLLPRINRLSAVHESIVQCERCPRLRTYCRQVAQDKRRAYREETYWGRPVPGFGDRSARLLLVGLAPAAHGANRTGRVFTGDGIGGSGDFLMSALHKTGFANMPTSRHRDDGLVLDDAYIVAAVRCAPPNNAPQPEEITRCLDHLEAEVAELRQVQVVVALGKIAFDVWLRAMKRRDVVIPSPRPQFAHGIVVRVAGQPGGMPDVVLGCYHPSRQNTNTGKLTADMMEAVFRKTRRLLR
jgi:uracil-DNA glycosylase family 4